jgi:hypothetical protein
MNSIIDMILKRLLGTLVNRGVNAGIDLAARRGKPASDLTPEERTQAQNAKQIAKRARQAARLSRRMMR